MSRDLEYWPARGPLRWGMPLPTFCLGRLGRVGPAGHLLRIETLPLWGSVAAALRPRPPCAERQLHEIVWACLGTCTAGAEADLRASAGRPGVGLSDQSISCAKFPARCR